jgi:HD-like signal output (HDOD) protein
MMESGGSPAQVMQVQGDVDSIVRQITEISTLPQIALKVIRVARDPNAGAAELTTVVEGDPALGTRVLKMVNSAAYGVRATVTNLHQAISYLGFNQVRNLAMTASVAEIFKKNEKIGTYQRSMLWRHLVSVGICARLVARRCKLLKFEDAFLAGLLHDVGIVFEDQHAHAQFCQVVAQLAEGTGLCDVERLHLGFDHCVLGAAVADAWRFPPAVRAAIRYHHGSLRYREADGDIVRCVEIANVICTLKGITSVGQRLVDPALETFKAMGFLKEDVVVLVADLDRELSLSENLFEL